MTQIDTSKRKFIKAATYVAPVILSLKVAPTFASSGSGRRNNHPDRPGDEPSNGGGHSGNHDGDDSSASASSNYSHIKKKKRRWYWPFV